MTSAWSCRQQETLGAQVHVCPAKQLALAHLQAIALACTRSLTPGPRPPGLHSGLIVTPPVGNASEGRESARGRARQPGIELGRLALADAGGEVLGERHGCCQFGRLRGQRRQLVVVLRGRPRRWTQDPPGGLTRGEPAVWRRRHYRQRLIAPALPGRQSLRLAPASDIQSHEAVLAPKALATDGPEERRAMPTATIPPG
jgi:hypothetical protein